MKYTKILTWGIFWKHPRSEYTYTLQVNFNLSVSYMSCVVNCFISFSYGYKPSIMGGMWWYIPRFSHGVLSENTPDQNILFFIEKNFNLCILCISCVKTASFPSAVDIKHPLWVAYDEIYQGSYIGYFLKTPQIRIYSLPSRKLWFLHSVHIMCGKLLHSLQLWK